MLVRVRLTPNARADAIGGIHVDAEGKSWLKAQVRAVPEKGRANTALVELLAKKAGIAKSRFVLEAGSTSRKKTLRLEHASEAEALALAALAG